MEESGASRVRRAGLTAAIGVGLVLGVAGIAGAASNPSPDPSAGTMAKQAPSAHRPAGPQHGGYLGHGPGGPAGPFGGALHGTFVVRRGSAFQTMQFWRGKASNVSSTSLTVTSADNAAQTFSVSATTLVNAARDGIGSVKNGDQVVVLGRGASQPEALQIQDLTTQQASRRQWGPPPPAGVTGSSSGFDGNAYGSAA